MRLRLPLPVFLALLAAGCSKSTDLPVYPVHGQILVNGQPAAGAFVVFHPAASDGRPSAFATSDAEGRFQLTTYRVRDGAPAGPCVVTVSWSGSEPADDGDSPNVLADRYSKRDASELRVELAPAANHLPAFELLNETGEKP